MLKALFIGFLFSTILGCSSNVPLASSSLDAKMKQFSKPDSGVRVYIVQNGGFMTQHRINFQVFMNQKLVSVMSGNTYSVIDVNEGENTLLISSPENQEALKFNASRGSIVFIGVSSYGGWTQMRAKDLRILTESEGKSFVLESNMAIGL